MSNGDDPRPAPAWRRWAPLAVIALALGVFFALRLDRQMSFERLIESRPHLVDLIATHRATAIAAFVTFYALIVAISAPGATLLTIAGGALFGFWQGWIAAALGATLGASALFLAASSTLGAWIFAHVGPRLAWIRAGFCDNAASYMLFLRLSPVFPFWLVNLAAALAGVPFRTFLWTTLVGILPANLVFSMAGASLDRIAADALAAREACTAAGRTGCGLSIPLSSIVTPQIFAFLIGLSLLALAPVLARRLRAARGEGPAL
jgi:uncharacterized membrane protein YdjX (TVP38/TMEM64 family)